MSKNRFLYPVVFLLSLFSTFLMFPASTGTMSLSPTDDTYVRAGKYAGRNYGGEDILQTKLPPKDKHEMEMYLQFDLKQVGYVVKDAKLRLYIKNGNNHAGDVYYVPDDSWNEYSLTFNNKPAFGQKAGAWVWQKDYVDVDLSDLARSESTADGILSLRVAAVTTSKTYKYYSKEYGDPAKHPVLQVTYYNPPEVTLTADPDVMQRGESSELSWTSVNADNLVIDQGIGTVGTEGSKTVSPRQPITYTITATGPGGTVTDTASIMVLNTPPTAYDLEIEVDEDSRALIVLKADDINGDELTYELIDSVQNGKAVLSGQEVVYVPQLNYNGTDSFTYNANDGEADSNIATVNIVVLPVNDPPVLEPINNIVMNEGETVSVPVKAFDIDGDLLTLLASSMPGFGSFTDNGDGTGFFTFSPGFDGSGVYTPVARVTDGLLEDVENFTLTVNNFTVPPVFASGDDIEGTEGETVSLINTAFTYINDVETFTASVDWGDGTGPQAAVVTVENGTGTIEANHMYADNSDYTVTITLTGSESGDIVKIVTARIKNADPVIYRENTNNYTTNIGDSYMTVFNFTDPGYADTHAATVDWGDGVVTEAVIVEESGAGSLNASHVYGKDGTNTIKIILTDDDGAVDEYQYDITVIRTGTGRTYTLNSDFEEGELINIDVTSDELRLNSKVNAFHFIWVAVSSKGTVVKIDTRTGEVLGEYHTAPNGQPLNPSRTTVDKNGNVWVGNRAGNSVVCIGLYENGQWIDKNGDGICQTSVGLGDVLPWTNADGADTNGGVSTAEDECILFYTKTNATGNRHVSVDKDNNIWVSGTGNKVFNLIDGKTGQVIRTEGPVGYGGYGGLIDKNGVIWSARPLLRWDPSNPLSGPIGGNWQGYSHRESYGLGIDSLGNVWNTGWESANLRKYAPDGTLLGTFDQKFTNSRGIVADRNDHMWIANSFNDTVSHFLNDGTYIGSIHVGDEPTGVALDGDGKIWVTNRYGQTVMRIDPEKGPIGADGVTRVGEVDFTSQDLGGQLYNYSDMTGSTLSGAPEAGTWSVIFDSELDGAEWGKITWNGRSYSDGAITVTACVSEDGATFGTSVPVVNSEPLAVENGRYIKITVNFTRASSGESPVLYDLSVGTKGYGSLIITGPNGYQYTMPRSFQNAELEIVYAEGVTLDSLGLSEMFSTPFTQAITLKTNDNYSGANFPLRANFPQEVDFLITINPALNEIELKPYLQKNGTTLFNFKPGEIVMPVISQEKTN